MYLQVALTLTLRLLIKAFLRGRFLVPSCLLLIIWHLPDVISSAQCVLCADDATLSCKVKTDLSLISKLNSVFSEVQLWCNNNDLTINPYKTQFMVFLSSPKQLAPAVIPMGPKSIHACDTVSLLGVRSDMTLHFGSHLLDIKKKTAFGIRTLNKARPYFSTNVLLSLFFFYS